jgi:hypothetical protein
MIFRSPLAALSLLACVACTSSSSPVAALPAAEPNEPAASDPPAEVPPSLCAPPKMTTACKTGGEAAIIRGVARFDPAKVPSGAAGNAALVVFLRHSWVYREEEATVGGRLHGYDRIRLDARALARGTVPFELDLCEFGTAMWSEENGAFNVVGVLDFDGSHDTKTAKGEMEFQTPNPGELAKMVKGVEVSCRGASPCIDLPLDCTDGASCTTFQPVTSVACNPSSCASDDAFCKGDKGH